MTLSTSDKFKKIIETSLTIAKDTFAFKRILLVYGMVLIISAIFFVVFLNYPSLNTILGDSRSTPWGIVTSIFAHWDLGHITLNMAALFGMMFLFAFCNCISKNRKRIESFFLASSFISAIISNIIWLLATSNVSAGASGLVYATEGNLLGFSLVNGLQVIDFSKLKKQNLFAVYLVVANLIVSIAITIQILTDAASFLGVGQGVNIIAHSFSFLQCFCASLVWLLFVEKSSILE